MRPFFLIPFKVSANAAYTWFEGYIMPTSQDSYNLDTSWELPSGPRSKLGKFFIEKQTTESFRQDVLMLNV